MDLDFLLSADAFLNKELHDTTAVVSLQLDDSAPLLVLVERSVAMPRLLERAQDLLQVEVLWQTLHESQALASRPLLEMQV